MAHPLKKIYSGPVIDNVLHIGPCIDCKSCAIGKKKKKKGFEELSAMHWIYRFVYFIWKMFFLNYIVLFLDYVIL